MSISLTVMGDSILKGTVLQGGRYVNYREPQDNFVKNTGLKLLNLARFGATTLKALKLSLPERIDKECKRRLCLIEYGSNDCDFNWAEIAEKPDEEHLCFVPPEQFEENYREIIRRVRAAGGEPLCALPVPIDSERFFKHFSSPINGQKPILNWLGSKNLIYRWQETYAHIVAKVAKAEIVPLIDIRTPFLSVRKYMDYIGPDGIHPTKLGQRLIWETLEKIIKPFLNNQT
ncbi:MAG: SGNH/GDSL hydrolase family protein [Candidatus Scatomorpha sp.]|jgi:acyl-CoA thioesterase-1